MTEVHGMVADGYEPVRDAFVANFDEGLELGASVGVYADGEPVVDLWAGIADSTTGREWAEDTIAVPFSVTKGMTATCANICIDRGVLDVDAPVAKYWPEFAQAGKEDIPVRWLLTHQSGVVAVDEPISMDDMVAWDPVIGKIERQAPAFEPGSATGYHASTYGWLVGEVVRRASGRTIGTFFSEEVAGPLGLDAHIGLPESELGRVARLEQSWSSYAKPDPDAAPTLRSRVFANPGVIDPDDTRNVTAERPAGGGVINGRNLARMYAGLIGEVDGVRVLSREQLDRARTCLVKGEDVVLGRPVARGLGYSVHDDIYPISGPGSFGHSGAGGSFGMAHPERNLAVGYVMNRMVAEDADPRFRRLLDAAVACAERAG
jgi:CubicO group peptidase (beta-lactamase class C family)